MALETIPYQLDRQWLTVDPSPDRHLFRPGTRDFHFLDEYGVSPKQPALPGAARAFVESVFPIHEAWRRALAQEAAPWHEEEHLETFGPPTGMVDDWAARYLISYDFDGANPNPGGVIDRYLGPFPHPYPGRRLESWAVGNGSVAHWALAAADASNPDRSRTQRRGAGRRAVDLRGEAEADWGQFRAALDAWADDATQWINRTSTTVPTFRPPYRAVVLS